MELKHLSHTQLSMISRCGEQYRRRYCLHEKRPPGIPLMRGRATHTAQEKNLRHKMDEGTLLEVSEVQQIAADSFTGLAEGEFVLDGHYSEMEPKEALGRGLDEAVGLATMHAQEIAPTLHPFAVETRIEIPKSEKMPCKFVSILDLIDQGGHIIDTKTAAKSPAADVAHESDQLTSQGLAYEARYDKPVGQLSLDFLVMTPTGKKKTVRKTTTRTWSDYEVILNRINAAYKAITAEIFVPAALDAWVCSPRWCGYARTCPYYRGRNRPTT